MTDWAPKRFWDAAHVLAVDGGYAVVLDTRPIRTPGGAALCLPTSGLAWAIASEWDAQTEKVDPGKMPLTRTANSAIDKVSPQMQAVIAILTDYGQTDLLSYRADGPADLVAEQAVAWDPLLDWAADTFGARLDVTIGVMPVPQSADAVAKLAAPMQPMSAFQLAAFHDLVSLTGSLVLALATTQGYLEPPDIWDRSRLDEEHQARVWGRDVEADALAATRRQAFLDTAKFFMLALPDS